jgi:hypothetical protein
MTRGFLSGNSFFVIREIAPQVQRKDEIAMKADLEKCAASA